MVILLLENLLQVPVASAGSVGKLGRAFLNQEFPLRPGIVFLRKYPLEFPKYLVLLSGHALPALFQPVDRVALEARDDSLEAAEVLEDPQLLGYVDPGLNDSGPFLWLGSLVQEQNGRDDPERHGVELVDGGDDRRWVVTSGSVASTWPNRTEALVGHQFLKNLGVHARQLLGEVPVRHLRKRVRRPAVAERVVRAVQAQPAIVVYCTRVICNHVLIYI